MAIEFQARNSVGGKWSKWKSQLPPEIEIVNLLASGYIDIVELHFTTTDDEDEYERQQYRAVARKRKKRAQ